MFFSSAPKGLQSGSADPMNCSEKQCMDRSSEQMGNHQNARTKLIAKNTLVLLLGEVLCFDWTAMCVDVYQVEN
jgi:hypothetical protein